MNTGIIYRTTHKPTGRFYVGKKVIGNTTTYDSHYRGSGVLWGNILRAHPDEDFEREILHIFMSPEVGSLKDSLKKKEIEEIAHHRELFGRYNEGGLCHNISDGGDGFSPGNTYGSANKGKPKSETHKRNIGNGKRGKKLGPQSPEHREAIRRGMTGFRHTEESKEKMRKPKSEETKAKMRKPKSAEARRNMSIAQRARAKTNKLLRSKSGLL